jgi:hypothetical protein
MMTSPSLQYASPSEGHHTPIGSPAPSQILLHRVASPNHLASQHHYVDSPRSVPVDYAQQYSAPTEQHFEYEHTPEMHTPEMYVNDDPHIYDFGPNGALQPEPQFAHPQMHQQQEANNFIYTVFFFLVLLLIEVSCPPTSTTDSHARAIRKSHPPTSPARLDDSILRYQRIHGQS